VVHPRGLPAAVVEQVQLPKVDLSAPDKPSRGDHHMSTQFHAPGPQAASRPDRARTATMTPFRRPTMPADAGRRIGVGVDAPKLWAGGAARSIP
jgi:hypothetical protein